MKAFLILSMTAIMITLLLAGGIRSFYTPGHDGTEVTTTEAPPTKESLPESTTAILEEEAQLSGIYLGYGGGMERGFYFSIHEDALTDEQGQTIVGLLMEADIVAAYDPTNREDSWVLAFSDRPLINRTPEDLRSLAEQLNLQNLPNAKPHSAPDGFFMTDGTMEYSLTLYFADGSYAKKEADLETYEQLTKIFIDWAKEASPDPE